MRCFWEAMKRDPNHQAACYQLAINLNKIGATDIGKAFMERARLLQELEVALTRAATHTEWTTELIRPIAENTRKLGRKWEANGWFRELLSLDPRAADARTTIQQLQRELRHVRDLVVSDENLARKFDFATLPLPQFDLPKSARAALTASQANSVSFRDIAKQAGIDFTYFNSDDPTTDGRRMV